jgi:hypothetical protein
MEYLQIRRTSIVACDMLSYLKFKMAVAPHQTALHTEDLRHNVPAERLQTTFATPPRSLG